MLGFSGCRQTAGSKKWLLQWDGVICVGWTFAFQVLPCCASLPRSSGAASHCLQREDHNLEQHRTNKTENRGFILYLNDLCTKVMLWLFIKIVFSSSVVNLRILLLNILSFCLSCEAVFPVTPSYCLKWWKIIWFGFVSSFQLYKQQCSKCQKNNCMLSNGVTGKSCAGKPWDNSMLSKSIGLNAWIHYGSAAQVW